jgi:DNA-binding IclR family transcriptional regulator
MSVSDRQASGADTVRQDLNILRLLCTLNEPTGVADIARQSGTRVSTALRALATLEASGYAERVDYSTKFIPGQLTAQLVIALFERYRIRSASLPFLRQLVFETGEPVTLNVRLGWYCLRVVLVEPPRPNYQMRRLGQYWRMHEVAPGRAILAHLSDIQVAEYISFIASVGNSVSIDEPALRRELDMIRHNRYDEDSETGRQGRFLRAIPVRDPLGKAIASVTVEHAGHYKVDTDFEPVRSAIDSLEELLRADRELTVDPFGHIPPQDIKLPDLQ